MQLFVKYAVNKSKSEVQMIDGYIRVPVGGWRGLTMREVEHPDVISALRRSWIILEDNEPTTPESPDVHPVELSDPSQGKTIEQVKARVVQLGVKDQPAPAVETPKVEEAPATKARKASQKALADAVKKE